MIRINDLIKTGYQTKNTVKQKAKIIAIRVSKEILNSLPEKISISRGFIKFRALLTIISCISIQFEIKITELVITIIRVFGNSFDN